MPLNAFNRRITRDFDPMLHLDKFEDFATAKSRQREIIYSLGWSSDCGRLIDKLKACRKDRRCLSAACPVCLRRYRRLIASRLCRFMDENADQEWRFLTLIPPDTHYGVGYLKLFDPKKMNDRLRKQIERSPLADAVIVGGWDFSLQFQFGNYEPRWRPHLHCVVGPTVPGEIQRALRKYYPKHNLTRLPVKVRKIKMQQQDLIKITTYTLKATIDRSNRGMQKTRPFCYNDYNKRHSLTIEQADDIYLLLDKMGIAGRMFRRNAPKGLNFR